VTVAAPSSRLDVYAGYRASIMVDACDNADDFKTILRDERKNAFVIGPGGGEDVREFTLAALHFNKKGVLDADVFTAFAGAEKELFTHLSPERHVLTPHEGEFKRLFGLMDGDKLTRARKAAKAANAVLVLKGADTVIAAPDGAAVINGNAPPSLATAGSGDVLAGLIAGLGAQGMRPFMAAAAGVWLHGEAARRHGFSLTPEDIINNIPQVLNTLFGLPPPSP